MQDVSESQPIAGVFTPRLVARLQRDAFDGALRFHSGSATRVVYFRRGDIASAASNAEDDRLHNILIREGRLSGPQVDMARSRLRPGATLGKTLIELGFLTPAELLSGARRQVRQILAACFALTEGVYQVSAGPLGPEVTNLGLPVRRLIFDALMESGERRTIVGEMGSMESVYGPTAALGEALPALRLEPAAEEVARRLDGRATLREISGRTHLDDFTVSKIVLALEIMGLSEVISRPEEEARPAAAIPARPGRVIPIESGETGDHIAPGAAIAAPAAPVPVLVSAPAGGNAPDPEPGPAFTREPIPADEPAISYGSANPSMPASASSSNGAPEPAHPSLPGDITRPSSSAGRDEFDDEGQDGDVESSQPPPFSRDELPAFAVPESAQEGWRVDPETGERIHEGPVEMTFDGAVVPAAERASTGSRWLGIGVVVAVVAFAALLAFRLHRPSPDATAAGGAAAAPTSDEAAPIETVPANIAAAPAQKEPDQSPRTQPEAAPPAAASSAAASSAATPSEPERPPVAPAVAPPRATETPAVVEAPHASAPPPARPVTVPPGDDDLGSGQARLDAGDVAGAGAIFARMVAASRADNLTLQVLIACETENILKARNATRPDGPLFVVPFRLQERSCWRVCWGRYGDREAARAAAAALPPYFTAAGLTPVVVSFGRLRPPG